MPLMPRRQASFPCCFASALQAQAQDGRTPSHNPIDRKSTRLNSSHMSISYAVFFFKKYISLIVFIVSALFFLSYFTPLSKSLFHASGTITEDLGGFDINSTALIFGSIALGGSSTRSILINNSYPFAIKVKLILEGSISDKIIYS